MVNGKGVKENNEILDGPGHIVIPPTVFKFMGLTIDPEWHWSKPFGL